jgi:hypothetical protein
MVERVNGDGWLAQAELTKNNIDHAKGKRK